jgi:hypothetical protein
MNRALRYGVSIAIGCLFGAIPQVLPAGEKSRERPALVDYFPPAEDHGAVGACCRKTAMPTGSKRPRSARSQGLIGTSSRKPGVTMKQPMGRPSGLLVICRGHVVGEWYKDCDRKSDFSIYSCSKAYTSTAFGLILTDFEAAANAGIKPLTLDTKVCNAEWIPEVLPLTDARKSEKTPVQSDRLETDSLDCQRRRRGDLSIQSRVHRRDDDRARTRPFLLPVTAPR